MQLRRFLGGLAVLAGIAVVPLGASAFSVVPCGGLDLTVVRSGKSSLIVSGQVTASKNMSPDEMKGKFPNITKALPATEYTIVGKVLKGNEDYQASDQSQTVNVYLFGNIPGPIIKGMLRPQMGSNGLHVFYGSSVAHLSSYVCNTEGFTPYVEKDGKTLAQSPYGKGLVFANKELASKFMSVNPGVSKMLRVGPALPIAAEAGEAPAPSVNDGEDATKEQVEDAVKFVLLSGKAVAPAAPNAKEKQE